MTTIVLGTLALTWAVVLTVDAYRFASRQRRKRRLARRRQQIGYLTGRR